MNELKCFFTRAFDYKGKSNRKEFLIPVLTFLALIISLCFLEEGLDVDDDIVEPLLLISFVVFILPFVSLCVRRLHDTLHSGWWTLLLLIPVTGLVFLGYLALARGASEEKEASKGCFIAAFVCTLLFPLFIVLPFIGLVVHDYVKDELPKIKCRSQLRNMYYLLDDYQREHGAYPILDPDGDDYGVRDLYLLFENNKKRHPKLEVLLQPPGRKYEAFSKELSIDDFNTNHIGWAYNAKARPGTDDPLLVEGGFWKRGDIIYMSQPVYLYMSEEPYWSSSHVDFKKHDTYRSYEIVLLANGRRVYIEKDIYGNLSTNIVQDWSVLRE
ncbi:DUF805 domain-containing protein [bacterium]|nr:DUF805 domain-containing protein [bacterium]